MRSYRVKASFVIVCAAVLFSGRQGQCEGPSLNPKLLTRKQALIIVEKTKEVEALYNLSGGHLKNCIEKTVEKPCESNWVTCIEDAWVVKFIVGAGCGIEHDGRLSETMLVNAKTGEIISRYPELPYFESPEYCHDGYDCLCQSGDETLCVNFIYGQLSQPQAQPCPDCSCEDHVCVKKDRPAAVQEIP